MKTTIFLAAFAVIPAVMGELEPRDCKPTKCSCKAIPDGLFCGDGLLGCVKGHVYQCGGDGKKSCHFGERDSCKKCNKLKC